MFAVELTGYLGSTVGVGEAARRYAIALRAVGVEVLQRDVPLPGRDAVGGELPTASSADAESIGCNILCLNPEQMVPFLEGPDAPTHAGRSMVGVWSWEVDVLPPGWREASRRLSEIWTYSVFSAKLIAQGVDAPVYSIPPPMGMPIASTRPLVDLPGGFRFLVMFDFLSTLERKNPLGAIEAYRRAFRSGDGAVLVVKSVNARHRPERHEEIVAACQGREDIVLMDRTISGDERDALVAACDCYVSLHRSEGHGLPIAEAMHAGKPVVATAYGGNTEFMDEENSYPVTWAPAKVGPGVEHYPRDATWAEPDLEQAARMLRAVHADPATAAHRASRGRNDMSRRLAPEVVGRQMLDRLGRLSTGSKGSEPEGPRQKARGVAARGRMTPATLIGEGEAMAAVRDSAVICVIAVRESDPDVLVQGALSTVGCLDDLAASLPVLIVGTEVTIESIVAELGPIACAKVVAALKVEPAASEVEAVNEAIRASCPADVVILSAGFRMSLDGLRGLRAAALSDTTVATATPLFHGGSWPARRAGGEREPGLRPRIATIGYGCAYLRRRALDLIDPLDSSLSMSRALDAAAVRLVALGMVHVAADDVAIHSDALPDESPNAVHGLSSAIRSENWIQETIACDERGVLRRAVKRGAVAESGLSVTIDGRSLTSAFGGTQTYVENLILALAHESTAAVRVLTAPDLSEHAKDALVSAGNVELLTYEQALADPPLTDIVHRPQQIFTPEDLALLRLVGERVVVTHQDLIAYHNYAYHSSVEAWRGHRRTTRLALAAADQVVFFSEHARHDALAEDLLSPDRAHVVGIGAEQLQAAGPARAPDEMNADDLFLLCLGADYAHKNRPFAIRLLVALRRLGWQGQLVFAGTHVPYGSSEGDERETLRRHPEIVASVVDLGAVDEPAKRWLYAHARALVCPTLYEGFGMLPLEAAKWRLPCLFASQTSLAEVAGEAATLVPWDARASAIAVLPLLAEGSARDSHLATLEQLHVPGWSDVVRRLVEVYQLAITGPMSPAAPRAWQELDRESHVVALDGDIRHLKGLAQEYQDAYHTLMRRVSGGLPLIDEGGLLSPVQQRGLMRVAGRRRVGGLLLAPLGLLGRRGP
jgi:glycosyltransferase involved in cell wall biosynthesis